MTVRHRASFGPVLDWTHFVFLWGARGFVYAFLTEWICLGPRSDVSLGRACECRGGRYGPVVQ